MSNPTRIQAWEDRTEAALTAYQAVDVGAGAPMEIAGALLATAVLTGWQSTGVQDYLNELHSLQNPDGGYGLNATYDPFGDGTVNPANTSYTITMCHHVGPILLEGYRAGVVPFTEVSQLALLVASTYAFVTSAGKCLAYSRSGNDHGTTPPKSLYQVHNVNLTAAKFLWDVRAISPIISAALIVDMVRHGTAAYNPSFHGWPYSAGAATVRQDRDHDSATAEGMHAMVPAIARECAYNLMTTTGTAAQDPLAHIRLVALPQDSNSMSTTEPDQTFWLVKGDDYLPEFDTYLAAMSTNSLRLGQLAGLAARNYMAAQL